MGSSQSLGARGPQAGEGPAASPVPRRDPGQAGLGRQRRARKCLIKVAGALKLPDKAGEGVACPQGVQMRAGRELSLGAVASTAGEQRTAGCCVRPQRGQPARLLAESEFAVAASGSRTAPGRPHPRRRCRHGKLRGEEGQWRLGSTRDRARTRCASDANRLWWPHKLVIGDVQHPPMLPE